MQICDLFSADWKPDRGRTIEFGKIFVGDDPIAVDRAACIAAGETITSYIDRIEILRTIQQNS